MHSSSTRDLPALINVDWKAQYDTTKKALDDIAVQTDRNARMGPKPEAVPL